MKTSNVAKARHLLAVFAVITIVGFIPDLAASGTVITGADRISQIATDNRDAVISGAILTNTATLSNAEIVHSTTVYAPSGTKTVTPTGQVHCSDRLTYTLVISATPGTQVGLYDPLEGTTWITFTQQPAGVSHADGVITGTLEVTSTDPITVSFDVRASIPVTPGGVATVTNRACIYPLGGTLGDCVWTNMVANTVLPCEIYLPLVLKRWPPIPYAPILTGTDGVSCGSHTMSWTESPERLAITYTVQEATDPVFTTHPIELCTTQVTSCMTYGKPAGTYYYRVRGQNDWGYGEWSNVTSVRVLSPLCVAPSAFQIRGDEFFLDTSNGAIPCIPVNNGVDLTNYVLEMTFGSGDGRRAQLYFKDSDWKNVYSTRRTIKRDVPIRFDPIYNPCDVCEFRDFTHIYAVGAKILGGTPGVTLASACLVRR